MVVFALMLSDVRLKLEAIRTVTINGDGNNRIIWLVDAVDELARELETMKDHQRGTHHG